jgi:FtsP/CotA-like multicopper oxidase with cupredoxin domain
MLETGPDTLMGIFGAVSPDGSADFVSILRFEPTAMAGTVKYFPARLVEPAVANSQRAVQRRQFVLDSGICGGQRPTETGMLPGMCINGKTHDMACIDVETELGSLEVWEIVSIGMAHPFHVHGASFRILSLGGVPGNLRHRQETAIIVLIT